METISKFNLPQVRKLCQEMNLRVASASKQQLCTLLKENYEDLENKTVKELKSICSNLAIPSGNKKKDQLCELIKTRFEIRCTPLKHAKTISLKKGFLMWKIRAWTEMDQPADYAPLFLLPNHEDLPTIIRYV